MAYSVTNPPRLVAQGLGGGFSIWVYESTDAEATFDDTDYFTNAEELGMSTGDIVFVSDTTNDLSSMGQVTVDADGNGTLTALTAIA